VQRQPMEQSLQETVVGVNRCGIHETLSMP